MSTVTITDKNTFAEWYGPIKANEKKREAFKKLVCTASPEAGANFSQFLIKDDLVPKAKGESIDQTRWRLINEWVKKLEVMDHSTEKVSDDAPTGDITDLVDDVEEEVVPSLDGSPQTFTGTGEDEVEEETEVVAPENVEVDIELEPDLKLSQPPNLDNAAERFLQATSDFIRSTEGPKDDTVSIDTNLEARGEKLEKKYKQLFNMMRDE